MSIGLKKRISDALEDAERSLAMGELMLAADVDKRLASEVSSALHKLLKQGRVRVVRGPAPNANGPRLVRKYIWVVQVVADPVAIEVKPDALRMLGISIYRG